MQSFGKAEKLEDYKQGRNYQEFLGKDVDPQTQVKTNENGMAIIAKSIVADEIAYRIKKMYKRNSDGSVSFFYALRGGINNITISEINLMSDLINASFVNDFERCFKDFGGKVVKTLRTRVSFEKELMYMYFVMSFEKQWEPDNTFEEMA